MFENILSKLGLKQKNIKTNSKEKEQLNFFKQEINMKNPCYNCELQNKCLDKGNYTDVCQFAVDISDIDLTKEIILIIDDNKGMVSFIKDDIIFLQEKNIISKDIEILGLTGQYAAFTLELILKKTKLNIKYAIIDITLGGSRLTKTGNIKYTGVDVFEMINTPNLKYLFYTGNNLNPNIKANKKLINQFNKITNTNIMNKVLYKTIIDMDTRRKYIAKNIFSIKNTKLKLIKDNLDNLDVK